MTTNEKSRSEDRLSRIEMSDAGRTNRIDSADSSVPAVGSHLGEDVRQRLLSAPAPYAGTEDQEYIAERVVYDPATGCWLFRLSLYTTGYGHVGRGGRDHQAHRFAYEAFVGPVPAGLVLDHLCEVTVCCNPWHLEPVTHAENIRRGLRSDTASHCGNGHLWAEHERRYPNGRRYCRACQTEAMRRRRRGEVIRPMRTDDTACRHGHELAPENRYINTDGVLVCRTCMRASRSRTSAARRDAALAYRAERFRALGRDADGEPIDDTEERA